MLSSRFSPSAFQKPSLLLGYVKTISRCKQHRCAPYWERQMHPQPQAGPAWWCTKTVGQQSTAAWGNLWYRADFVGGHVCEEGRCTASFAASPSGIRRTTGPILKSTARSSAAIQDYQPKAAWKAQLSPKLYRPVKTACHKAAKTRRIVSNTNRLPRQIFRGFLPDTITAGKLNWVGVGGSASRIHGGL